MHGYRGENVELLGYHDLDGMPGFKLQLQVLAGAGPAGADRWLLYLSRFWHPGTTILDVTDPTAPEVVGEVPAPDDPNVASWQIQVADGLLIQGLEHRPVPWGGDPSSATDEGLRIWDVRDPAAPALLGRYRWGSSGTHRNYYTGGRYVHATAAVPGVDGNVYAVLDIDDPTAPVEVGRFQLPEQTSGSGRRLSLHGPPYPVGDRAYLPYGAAGVVIVDTSDLTAIREVSRLDIGAAFASTIAMHTVIPLPDRGLAVVNTEAIAELTEEPYNFAGIVDLADETAPRLVSLLPPPVPAPDAGYPNFNRRGGRFGPHNQHHHQGMEHLLRDDTRVHLTWFNAGLRIYDTTDPYLPREVAWFLPDDPTERRGPLPRTALVTQSEDVLVDARGVIYLTDKNHGLHLLRATI